MSEKSGLENWPLNTGPLHTGSTVGKKQNFKSTLDQLVDFVPLVFFCKEFHFVR